MNQLHVLNTISQMLRRYIPGTDEEKQLVHLINANIYMKKHDCTLTEALQATAKEHPGIATAGDVRLDHLKRAYEYRDKFECSLTEALSRTAPDKKVDSDSEIIVEQLEHVERARRYQDSNDCSFEEALRITAPNRYGRR